MLIRRPPEPLPSEITPHSVYASRRNFLKTGAAFGTLTALGLAATEPASAATKLDAKKTIWTSDEKLTPQKDVTGYNNFYEFGPDKTDPAARAPQRLKTQPWTVKIDGEVKKPLTLGIDELLKLVPLEERIYRLRCVEGWSMVIPWIGLPLAELIKRVEPNGNAKYVEFTSLADPEQMPYVRTPLLDWPYVEGLRLDEAMNPLTLLAVGLYGEVLPAQNGAPVRLVVPWKYGFKSAKSIVHIRFVRDQPRTAWVKATPSEYGFYSNVNPAVDHPRWSQAQERRIGEFFKRKTLPFNGYAEQVAGLYTGMDLRKFF